MGTSITVYFLRLLRLVKRDFERVGGNATALATVTRTFARSGHMRLRGRYGAYL